MTLYPLSSSRRGMAVWLRILAVLLIGSLLCSVTPQCDVQVPVEPPWPTMVYVPHNASIHIICTTDSASPFWSIDPAGDQLDMTFFQFVTGSDVLNDYGMYELPRIETPGMPPTLRLLINETVFNNQTVIQCVGRTVVRRTTVYLYELSALMLQAEEVDAEQSVNISWVDPDKSNRLYNLTITNTINQQWTFPLQDPNHVFTAPKGAPPCEVYNFSVTATYVGATYTGDGCSVPSPVLSTMLPSLPEISSLQSSHNYSLEKRAGEIVLTVYFQPAMYCDDYPVTNYTLEVTMVGAVSSGMQFTSLENAIKAGNLSDDSVYVYQLSATNSVGTVSTNLSKDVYTTDVQGVQIEATETINQVRVQCDFIRGSDAGGCVVVLVPIEDLDNITVNLTRESDGIVAVGIYQLPHPQSCYHQAYALDIEADGSTGTLRVPGQLNRTSIHTAGSCMTLDISQPSQNVLPWAIPLAIIVLLLAAVIIVLIIVIVIMRVHPKFKTYSGRFSISLSFEGSTPSPNTTDLIPMYAVPNKSKKSKNGRRISHDSHKAPTELVDSTRLESERVTDVRMIQPTNEDNSSGFIMPAPALPPRFQQDPPTTTPPPDYSDVCVEQSSQEIPDESNEHMTGGATPIHLSGVSSTPPKVDPTYQDIVELSDANEAPTSHVELLASSTPSLSVNPYPASMPNPGPIYQEVTELPERRVPVDNQELRPDTTELPTSYDEHEVRLTPPQGVVSDSAGTATILYQEVPDLPPRGMSVNSNEIVDNRNLIDTIREAPVNGMDNDHVDSRLTPPQPVSGNTFGGFNSYRVYDEVTERPRVITPVNFVEATDDYNSPEPLTSRVGNSTPPPPSSSPLPTYATYATVAPRSTRSRGTEDVPEQPSNLEVAPHNLQSYPLSPQHDEVTERPRVITPVSFVESTDNYNSPELLTSRVGNSTPPPPSSPPLPTYATVAPRSTRSRGTADIPEQPPKLELASPDLQSFPLYPQHDEITERPRVISPASFVESTANYNSSEPLTSRVTNSTPPPPSSSPLPAYASVAPRSTRSRGTVDVSEQAPNLEIAPPDSHSYPFPHSSRPGENFLDEWDDFKIPPGGTLV